MAETDKPAPSTEAEPQAQPGTVIVPSGAPRQAEQRTGVLAEPPSAVLTAALPPVESPKPSAPNPTPTLSPEPIQAVASVPAPAPAPTTASSPPPAVPNSFSIADDGTIDWVATEFVAHDKSADWYVRVLLAGALLAGLVFLLTRDLISTSVVIVGAFVLAIYGARKPKQRAYQASTKGFSIGQRHYNYEEFRSFAVAPAGHLSSVIFMPLKRFAPLTTIYFEPEHEDKIVDLFADILPLEKHSADLVDRFMQRIRF